MASIKELFHAVPLASFQKKASPTKPSMTQAAIRSIFYFLYVCISQKCWPSLSSFSNFILVWGVWQSYESLIQATLRLEEAGFWGVEKMCPFRSGRLEISNYEKYTVYDILCILELCITMYIYIIYTCSGHEYFLDTFIRLDLKNRSGKLE